MLNAFSCLRIPMPASAVVAGRHVDVVGCRCNCRRLCTTYLCRGAVGSIPSLCWSRREMSGCGFSVLDLNLNRVQGQL